MQVFDGIAVPAADAVAPHGNHPANAMRRGEAVGSLSFLSRRLGRLHDLAERERHRELLLLSLAILQELPALAEFDAATAKDFISLVRMTGRAAAAKPFRNLLCEHEAVLEARNAPSLLRDWAIGTLAAARADIDKALSLFLGCSAFASGPRYPGITPLHEAANIHFACGDLAKVRSVYAKMFPFPSRGGARERADYMENVAKVCGTATPLLVPECLIDVIFEELRCAPLAYEPLPRSVMAVSQSLAMGGGARNLVRLLGSLARDSRVAKLAVALRSLAPGEDDFFLPQLEQIPLEPTLYGPGRRSQSSSLAQTLNDRSRLSTAVDLLPSDLQEDTISLLEIILRERPRALLVRLDNLAGAVAGAMAGVPNIVLYRGSTSPDLWNIDPMRNARFARPRRHAYRRLLERPGVVVANVSSIASASDMAWLDWPDPSRFARVWTAIDVDNLALPTGRNEALRAKLGISNASFVVGGAFRLSPEKRPELWIAAAALIGERLSDAHFVIVGDGEMRDDICRYAADSGIADRLHLPGAVRDVGSWYRIMDLHMLTSEREGLSNAAIECQYFGVPILAPDVGGLSEAMQPDITGRLVPKDAGPAAFAAEAIRIWQDAPWRESARSSAPAFVTDRFSAASALEDMIACLGL